VSEDVVNVIDGEEGDCCTAGPTTSEGADASAEFWLAQENAGIGNAHIVGDLADGIVTHENGVPGVISNASGSIGQALIKNASNEPEWTTIPSSVSLSSATPYTVGTASAGVASTASRSDHRHDLPDIIAAATVVNPGSLTYDAKGRITASTAGTAGVPSSRTIATTSPLLIDGGASADLSANRTISIPAATNASAGHATAAQIALLENIAAADLLTWSDETALLTASRRPVAGTNVTLDTTTPGQLIINVAGAASAYATIENNGSAVTQRATLNLSTEFTATDDAGNTETDLALTTNGVAYTKLAQLAALSVLGNATNGTADLAAITAGTTGHVLRRSGTALAFGTLEAGAFAGTQTNGFVVSLVAGVPTWSAAAATGYATIERPNGTPVTQRSIVSFSTAFSATDNVDTTDIDLATAGVAFAKLADGSARSVLGRATNSSGVMASITGSSGQFLKDNGTTLAFAAIAGTDLSGFTDTTIPVANSSGQLVSSAITLASNVLTHAASASGANVGLTVSNTSNTASATATITARVAGTTASAPRFTLGRTGGTDWHLENLRATNDVFGIVKGSTTAFSIDPATTYNQCQIKPNGTNGASVAYWSAANDTRTGTSIFGLGFSANYYLSIGPSTGGTAGHGVAGIFYDGTGWRNSISWAHVASVGAGRLLLMENGGNVVVGAMATPTTTALGFLLSNGTLPTAAPVGGSAFVTNGGVPTVVGTDGIAIVL
jgi:hypothetical protein